MKEVLYIVIPAYNEAENIENTVVSWYPILKLASKESRIVIADSGSTDSTHNILKQLQKTYSQLEIIGNTEKQHGPKLIALYQHSIINKADYIFQTDADGQTNPAEFNDFWKLRTQYDAILGKRMTRGDGNARKFVEKVLCMLLWIIFGTKFPDANAPFRLMKTKLVTKYIKQMDKNYNLPNVMLTTFFGFHKENIVFKEISFKSRQGGVNSINILKIVKIGCLALLDFFKFRRNM